VVGGLAADHALLATGSLWPRSTLVGPNLRRLPMQAAFDGKVALTFDDGPDPVVTPCVLARLEERGVRATFFCVGRRAEEHPGLVAEIARRGHRVENHSYLHSAAFCFLGPRAIGRELDRAQAALTRHAGSAPRWFRAPAGLRNPWLDAALRRRGLELVSWTRRAFDTVSSEPGAVVRRLTRGLAARDVLVLHDRGSALTARGAPVVLEALPRVLDALDAAGLSAIPLPPAVGQVSSVV
jgi:peptidoglycan/xylan/chitin deacetylase (PgdA/CDA1 family)